MNSVGLVPETGNIAASQGLDLKYNSSNLEQLVRQSIPNIEEAQRATVLPNSQALHQFVLRDFGIREKVETATHLQGSHQFLHYSEALITMSQHMAELEETRFTIVASIRDNVRNLPSNRYAEIFDDFEGAVKSRNIGYLADTVVNWALGGHGYRQAGSVVNRTLDDLPNIHEDADLSAAWEKYKAETRNDGF